MTLEARSTLSMAWVTPEISVRSRSETIRPDGVIRATVDAQTCGQPFEAGGQVIVGALQVVLGDEGRNIGVDS